MGILLHDLRSRTKPGILAEVLWKCHSFTSPPRRYTFALSEYIGAGKDYSPGTFFSSFIDDVRIYNRVVKT